MSVVWGVGGRGQRWLNKVLPTQASQRAQKQIRDKNTRTLRYVSMKGYQTDS